MGPGRHAMNLAALASRGRDLQRSLDQMVAALQHNAHNITWCAWDHLCEAVRLWKATRAA